MTKNAKKHIGIVALIIILMSTFVLVLVGCKKFDFGEIDANNLMKNAQVSASDNTGKAKNVSDNRNSKWDTKKKGSEIIIEFTEPTDFNTIVIKEPSDSINEFNIYYKNTNGEFEHLYKQDRIDKYRLCAVKDTKSNTIKIVFDNFEKKTSIEEIEVYNLKNNKSDFRVNAYIVSDLDSNTGKTAVQSKCEDADYAGWFTTLTDVTIIGNFSLNADGTITYGTGKENLKKDVEIIKTMNPNVKVHVTVMTSLVVNDFKGNNKAIVNLTKNNENFKKAMENIREGVEYCGLDGVDYDWEFPQTSWEWDAYNKLILGTKRAINGREIAVALWPYRINLSKEAMAAIDTINLMAYDQFDKRNGVHSSIYEMGLDVLETVLDVGFTKKQVRLGIPFYGRTADGYAIWPNYNEKYGEWINADKDYTYVNADNETITSTNYLNGYAMVRDKTALAIAQDLGGIMIFRSECDIGFTNQYSLHKAVQEAIDQRISGHINTKR